MDSIDFPPARIRLAGLTLFWLGNGGFAAFLLAAPWHQTELAVIITCVICGLILVPIVAFMLTQAFRAVTRRSLITLTPDGVTDHRISPQQLSWSDLDWQTYPAQKGGRPVLVQSVMLRPKVLLGRVFWTYRLLARFYGALDLPAYPVLPFGTGVSADEIAAAFARFKRPSWKRPAG